VAYLEEVVSIVTRRCSRLRISSPRVLCLRHCSLQRGRLTLFDRWLQQLVLSFAVRSWSALWLQLRDWLVVLQIVRVCLVRTPPHSRLQRSLREHVNRHLAAAPLEWREKTLCCLCPAARTSESSLIMMLDAAKAVTWTYRSLNLGRCRVPANHDLGD